MLITSATVSLTIELLQLSAQKLFSGGHVVDINDFIWNAVGGVTGNAIFIVLACVPIVSVLVDRFRWHSAAGAARTD